MRNKILLVVFFMFFIMTSCLGYGLICNAADVGIYDTGESVATSSDAETPREAASEKVIADDKLYLSMSYSGKSLDDLYAMLVSCRNVLLLLLFVEVIRWFDNRLRTIFKRND